MFAVAGWISATYSAKLENKRGNSVQQLDGKVVLVVEDEALIALDIVSAFDGAGARVLQARSIAQALRLIETDCPSAAILDLRLADGDAHAVCARLDERKVPFILHSGYADLGAACGNGVVISKPADPRKLMEAVLLALERAKDACVVNH